MIEFTPWSKIARLNRDITITEKIDGTNAAVGVVCVSDEVRELCERAEDYCARPVQVAALGSVLVYAQSRKNIITPDRDNFGFARWAWDNAEGLAHVLGPGLHFGEWWGSGIQRGYGLPQGEKRFSLFNIGRWGPGGTEQEAWEAAGYADDPRSFPEGLSVVPMLYEGPFREDAISASLGDLDTHGSVASPGFDHPEGIVIYHHAARQMFKVTLEGDEAPKSAAA